MTSEEFLFAGEVLAPEGLSVLRGAFPKESSIEVVQSGYDGTLYLKACAHGFDLEMDSAQSDSFVFSGGVDGDADYAKFRVSQISTGFCSVGLTHRIELDNQHRQIAYFHHNWPQTSPPDDPSEPLWRIL